MKNYGTSLSESKRLISLLKEESIENLRVRVETSTNSTIRTICKDLLREREDLLRVRGEADYD